MTHSPQSQERLDELFSDAVSGLPATAEELPQYAAKLRQMVCSKLIEEYATNLAGSIDELLDGEEAPAETAEPEAALPDPAPVVQGESPPPNPV